jgi:chitodextrinase
MCGSAYTVGIDAYDAAGNRSPQALQTIATAACPPDTTPPSAPTNLTVSNVGPTSFKLSWTASTDNVGVTGYDVYQGAAEAGSTTALTYTYTGLTCGTTYSLGVEAFDAAR